MATPVEGPENSGQAAVRPPVTVGGVYSVTPPTFAAGQVGRLNIDSRGNLRAAVVGVDSNGGPSIAAWAADAVGNLNALTVLGVPLVFNGATLDRLRTPAVFKSFASTAITAGVGATIWTPGAGKKFRLMGWLISTSVAGQLIFGDNLVGTVIARSEAAVAAGVSNPVDLGNGILSALANNVLKLDGPTGNVAGMVWGTEE